MTNKRFRWIYSPGSAFVSPSSIVVCDEFLQPYNAGTIFSGNIERYR